MYGGSDRVKGKELMKRSKRAKLSMEQMSECVRCVRLELELGWWMDEVLCCLREASYSSSPGPF